MLKISDGTVDICRVTMDGLLVVAIAARVVVIGVARIDLDSSHEVIDSVIIAVDRMAVENGLVEAAAAHLIILGVVGIGVNCLIEIGDRTLIVARATICTGARVVVIGVGRG